MAQHVRVNGSVIDDVPTPLTLTALQLFVGGFVYFVELSTGDLMVVNEASRDQIGFYNPTASPLAGKAGPIYGDAILCSPAEIA